MIKLIFTLVLFVAIGLVMASGGIGDGMFEFNTKARAEKIVVEARAIDEGIKAYAAQNDGVVDFGDPNEGEDPLMYIKEKNYIHDRAGMATGLVKEWFLSEDREKMQGVVRSENMCKYINESHHGRPTTEPTPECGTEEGDSVTCCAEPSGDES
jgi:hypothetical protein